MSEFEHESHWSVIMIKYYATKKYKNHQTATVTFSTAAIFNEKENSISDTHTYYVIFTGYSQVTLAGGWAITLHAIVKFVPLLTVIVPLFVMIGGPVTCENNWISCV